MTRHARHALVAKHYLRFGNYCMSRIGRYPIAIPDNTDVTLSDGFIVVKGPQGELRRRAHQAVSVSVADGQVVTKPATETREAGILWGTFASHIRNMIHGVNEPFVKKLVVEGIGYKVDHSGNTLTLSVGFSHPVALTVPEGLTVSVEKNMITITGPDKEAVGQFAADSRAVKKPEPYKGKGIRYEDEVVHRKQGKKGAA